MDRIGALNRYSDDIQQFTRRCPRSWREDARSELGLAVLEICAQAGGKIDDNLMKLQLLCRLRDFANTEYQSGMSYLSRDELPRKARYHLDEIDRQILILKWELKKGKPGQSDRA